MLKRKGMGKGMSKGNGNGKSKSKSKVKSKVNDDQLINTITQITQWLKAYGYHVYSFTTNHNTLYLYAVLECYHTLFVEVSNIQSYEFSRNVTSVPNNYYIHTNTLPEFIAAINKIINGQ